MLEIKEFVGHKPTELKTNKTKTTNKNTKDTKKTINKDKK